MKLIYLHQYFKFPDESGGTRSYDLAKSFVQNGYQVDMVTTTSDIKYKTSKRWFTEFRDGLTVHYIFLPYSNKFSYAKRILIFFQFLWFSSFKVLALKGDLVLATSTPLTIGIPALVKKFVHGTPFIFEVRDVWPEAVIAIGVIKNKLIQRILFSFEKMIYHQARAIVPLSMDMEKSISNRFPEIKSKPIVVIENIASLDRFAIFNTDYSILHELLNFRPRFAILYAGTFGKVNGINYVVDLAEKILPLDPSIVFLLIGDGSAKQTTIELAIKKNVYEKNIFFCESVAKDDLSQLYFEANMGSSFVIPIKELWANSANKFFDTLAASKPVLINHGGWQKDVIIQNNLGYVLSPRITETEVLNFVAYTKKTSLHLEQGKNAFAKAKEIYSLEVATQKYIKLFNQIL